ncbi:MAG: LysM peptidoglycan-binding domain-containing protein [Ilumatobacteraceae bacterium]|nr:LysM peptidoglycan-binding domain-containing protein [Ilumatobacteraceae bacterium]
MHVKWVISVLVGAALFSACGDGSASGSSTTTPVNLNSTAYATLAPTLSTMPPETSAATAGQVSPVAQDYKIVAGDVPVNVAKRFGVSLDALTLANANTLNYASFYVGLVIKIPEGALVPAPTTTVAGATANAGTTSTLAADANGCTTGSYTIVAGDLPGKVAKSFDVTLDQLNAANANTSGYTNFIVDVTIVIPCT